MASIKKMEARKARIIIQFNSELKECHILEFARESARDYARNNRTQSRQDAQEVLPIIEQRIEQKNEKLEKLSEKIANLQSRIEWIQEGRQEENYSAYIGPYHYLY